MRNEKNVSPVTQEAASSPERKIVAEKVVDGSVDFAALILLEPPSPFSAGMIKMYFCCLLAFFCSTMNGYDGSLMNGMLTLKSFDDTFGARIVGLRASYISSMYQIGGAVALPFIGPAVDTWGRRWGMFIGTGIIVLGTVVQGTTFRNGNLGQYLGGRFLLGFGISIAASAGPAYVVEMSHPAYRGVVTGLYNCLWFSGSILAAGVTRGSVHLSGNDPWIIPTWLQALYAGIVFSFCLFLPESPRWLFANGRREEAKAVLAKYHGNGNDNSRYVTFQLKEFEEVVSLGADKRFWDYSSLFRSRAAAYRVMCNVIVSIFGQWAGNAVISYFLPAVLSTAGVTNSVTVLNINLGLAFASAFCAICGAFQVDRFGRRRILLVVNSALSIIWVAVTVSASQYAENGNPVAAKVVVAFVYIFGMVYSFGYTPLQALYPVEVLSFEQRAKGMAFSSFAVSAAGLLNQFAWPNALKAITWKVYIIFTIWCAVQAVVIYCVIPETKNRTLEELDYIFNSPNPVKASTEKHKIAVDASHQVVAVESA